MQCSEGPRFIVWALVSRVGSWALWWTEIYPRAVMMCVCFKTVGLLMGGVIFLPS